MDSARGRQASSLSLSPHSWTHEKEIVEVSLCGNSTSVLVFYLSNRKLSQPDDQKKVKWEEYFVPKFHGFFLRKFCQPFGLSLHNGKL
jgi:hypothetical protein